MDLDVLLNGLLEREGGYVNNPKDRGGPTNFGITEAVAQANGFTGGVAALTRQDARAIYLKLYWQRPRFDQVAAISPLIATELFDTGVNMGPTVAAQFLQRALSALNRGGNDYADLIPDGKIGDSTLSALAAYIRIRGAHGEDVLLCALNCLQGERYIRLAEGRPANEAFVYGWLANRVGGV